MRTIDYSIADDGAGIKPVLREFAEALIPSAASRLRVPASELKKRLQMRLVDSRYSTEVNAYASRSGCVVSVTEALFIFYHKMLKVFVATLDVADAETKMVEKKLIPWRRVVRVTKRLIEAYLENRILLEKGFRLEELTDGQEHILGLLRGGCEKFAIAHELGHVIILRSKGKVPEYTPARKVVLGFLRGRDGLGGPDRKAMVESWTNELCADLIGLKLLLSARREEGEGRHYKGWLASAAIISCELRWMIEDYEVRHDREYTRSATHPDEFLRVKFLNSFVSKEMPDEPNYSGYFFDYGMRVLDAIFPSSKAGSAD
jgi:hypothetical protein